jgi:hypothetical protein
MAEKPNQPLKHPTLANDLSRVERSPNSGTLMVSSLGYAICPDRWHGATYV